jgi:hypothetical protein
MSLIARKEASHILVLCKNADDPTTFNRIGVSDNEEAWEVIGYREKAGRLFEDAQKETVKLA